MEAAAASLWTLPGHSVLKRLLVPVLHELDMHYCDPRTEHLPLGGVDVLPPIEPEGNSATASG